MSNESTAPPQQGVQILTGDDMARGRYSNNLAVAYNPEEFILDWLLSSPGGIHLVSRVIVSPSHAKRIVEVLSKNLERYEEQFGGVPVRDSADPHFH
ncbi:MAG TPA: DUF3467 domain-containing protein [Syntrophales bacterium]|jgi:hypothetical protein|nr:DUF3467 domain-containing protein [Syntrophales bacterium]